jgi:outer membrane lipoprotein LolB
MKRRACALLGAWLLGCSVLLAAGCAIVDTGARAEQAQPLWQGRLAVKVASEPPQAFSANFVLAGSPNQGMLTLTSVLGTSLATLRWDAVSASLKTPQTTQEFASADDMVAYSVGTPLPIATLFGWLRGDATTVAGWQVDLQSLDSGRIKAWRLAPDAAAEIKIILDPG